MTCQKTFKKGDELRYSDKSIIHKFVMEKPSDAKFASGLFIDSKTCV